MLSFWKIVYLRWSSERKVKLEESIFEEQWVIRPKEPINDKPVHVCPPPPRRYSRIFHSFERYLGLLNKEYREKLFLMEDREHRDNLKIYNEMMLDIDSKKKNVK